MFSDFDFSFSARLLATETARIHQPVYLYHFDYIGPGPFAALGAFHAEELMFLSQHYWTTWPRTPADARLSNALIGYWVRFIQTGNPNRAGLPPWPSFTPKQNLTQILRPHHHHRTRPPQPALRPLPAVPRLTPQPPPQPRRAALQPHQSALTIINFVATTETHAP